MFVSLKKKKKKIRGSCRTTRVWSTWSWMYFISHFPPSILPKPLKIQTLSQTLQTWRTPRSAGPSSKASTVLVHVWTDVNRCAALLQQHGPGEEILRMYSSFFFLSLSLWICKMCFCFWSELITKKTTVFKKLCTVTILHYANFFNIIKQRRKKKLPEGANSTTYCTRTRGFRGSVLSERENNWVRIRQSHENLQKSRRFQFKLDL